MDGRLRLFLAVSGVSSIALAVLCRKRLMKQINIIWEGDKENSDREKMLKKISKCEEMLLEISVEIQQTAIDIEELRKATEEVKKHQEQKAGQESGKDDDAGLSGGYYHFDSQGNKIPTKWDSYNVDAELEKMDKEEQTGNGQGPEKSSKEKRMKSLTGKIRKSLSDLLRDTERIMTVLDTKVRGDEVVKTKRKLVATLGNSTWGKIEKAQKAFLEIISK